MKRKNGSKQGQETELAGKLVSASRSEMTEIVLPAQTNPLGKLLGGHVMHLVDMAGAFVGHPHSCRHCVVGPVGFIHFYDTRSGLEIVLVESTGYRAVRVSLAGGVGANFLKCSLVN